MEKQTIFRKVYVHDRLPEKDGVYLTDKGILYYHEKFNAFKFGSSVEYWLEEITWHNKQVIIPCRRGEKPTTEYCEGYTQGANFILNKLKS